MKSTRRRALGRARIGILSRPGVWLRLMCGTLASLDLLQGAVLAGLRSVTEVIDAGHACAMLLRPVVLNRRDPVYRVADIGRLA